MSSADRHRLTTEAAGKVHVQIGVVVREGGEGGQAGRGGMKIFSGTDKLHLKANYITFSCFRVSSFNFR